jgi:4-diphosphocytidyl-2-C-methyl-D-erythritol kinase
MGEQLVLEAPAKVNLTLNVLGKRPDGYHELETVMQQISLQDRVKLCPGGVGIKLYSPDPRIPAGSENLAWQAAWLMYEEFSLAGGLEIFLEKNIPVGAGLAGGSTDAAAVIKGVDRLWGLDLPAAELARLGLILGSDVPFCLQGGTALARGRGEILTPLRGGPRLEMVLVKPDAELSTAEIYRDFRREKVTDAPDNPAFLEAWRRCDIIALTAQMKNVLESVSIPRCPEVAVIKEKLIACQALVSLMSGSGPSVVGIFANREKARGAWEILREQYQECYLVSSYNRGD